MTARTFETMGTVVSVRTAAPLDEGVLAEVQRVFARWDRAYSLYDPASPLSRAATGELSLADCGGEVLDTYALALEWRSRTDGVFTPHRPDGTIDLSGVVKALAAREAGDVLDTACSDWLLNAGGDVLCRGGHEGQPWSVGVVDPDDRGRLAAVAAMTAPWRAVATSGTAERGEHIWRRDRAVYAQTTVASDDLVTADVVATAIIAGDESTLSMLSGRTDVEVLAFRVDGGAEATPGAREWLRPG